MSDVALEIIKLIGALAVGGVAMWGTVRASQNSARQRREESNLTHEISLTEQWQAYATEMKSTADAVRAEAEKLEERMTRRIDALSQEVHEVRRELEQERAAKSLAERQRDAAVDHAQELRDTWPTEHQVIPAPPAVIAGLLRGTPPYTSTED